ncbi:MAG: SPOR domain-containing protein [Castellaniella sp.]|uniref:SPOR domain-containing protein n=1 Tax=Castellaniella sp. TaxID=1955812 RepID=UPI00121D845B|nr:SPOR domain-containing protein [Castellaniella sp.]TAN30682.1 MAG: SPOR domain-containing protein [Castellaniella sp.]
MFFRHGADSENHAAVRTRGTNEAQLKELRAKARRRLIGALVLVLAAVVVVPWLFQEPVTDDTHAPAVVPATPAGLPPAPASPPSNPASPDAGTPAGAVNSTAPAADAQASQGTVQPAAPSSTDGQGSSTAETAAPQPALPATEPAHPKPEPKTPSIETRPPESTSVAKSAKKPPVERTDDGSVARALLAGKSPAKSSAPAKSASGQGRYFLQVAAYTVEQDALSRRNSLRQAGVTDAYIEKGQSAGRTVYRLRVGPFGSHEAAQAAQARLRALGYQNGLISAN